MRHICCKFLCIFVYDILLISTSSSFTNETDRLALLDLKTRVSNDPFRIMSSWNDSTHFCDWIGITCDTTIERVQILNLEAGELTGSIPPSLGNLTFLTEIRLGNNNFHGRVPQELGRLLRLQHLTLPNNNFAGEIPTNISHCTELVVLEFGINSFVGQIPYQFFTLTKLNQLGFGANNLSGTIPHWIGNFSSLSRLSFMQNNFRGNIPSEVGFLRRLELFTVALNHLTGTVPPSIYNISSLTILSLTENQFQGTLPPNVGLTLPNLEFLGAAFNNFSGSIPASLGNISNLEILEFNGNRLIGMLPNELGRLRHLTSLNFADNRLGSGKVGDLSLIRYLANSTNLRSLGLRMNYFGGALPPSIANLSSQLAILSLAENLLTGGIPAGIENLINLEALGLGSNYVNGGIPPNIGKLKKLTVLILRDNKLTGPIPSTFGNLSSLIRLVIQGNRLEGRIPSSLGQCRSLQVLGLSRNNLSGSIPKEVFGLSSLSIYLALDYNSFTGSLPFEVGKLVSLTELDISENKLSGDIPSDIGKCISIERLSLANNRFEGMIPQSLQSLRGLEALDLSSNNLSGSIPQFLSKFLVLKYLNLSYNNLEGKVPNEGVFSNATMISILGNKHLCDGLPVLHLPPCPPNQTRSSHKFLAPNVLIPVVSIATFVVILLSIFFVYFILKKSRKNASTSSSTNHSLPKISYSELNKSTNGFSLDNLIGSGSFGSVYKGILSNGGPIVAIKVLNLQQQGASKSFFDECKALTCIRHRNLLKIITCCSSIDVRGNDFKALVFDFMPNGNLDCWLHSVNDGHSQRRLSLTQRLNIAIDIASALDYLHNQCETPIVHCDLKPSNVLLDDDMVAHVGDFGLARFILEGSKDKSSFSQTMSLTLKGSIGYIPPEYGTGGRVSIEGDIFSYGIILLEMISGKRPTNDMFGDGVDIHLFTTTVLSQGVFDIVDHSLLPQKTCQEEDDDEDMIQERSIMGKEDHREVMPKWMKKCVTALLKIGLSCSSKSPSERTSMDVVVNELLTIKSSYYKFLEEDQRLGKI